MMLRHAFPHVAGSFPSGSSCRHEDRTISSRITCGFGVWSLRICKPSENLFIGVVALSTIVHILAKLDDSANPIRFQMSAFARQIRNLHEDGEIALFLRREKLKPFEERDHVFSNCGEVINFVVPNSVPTLTHRAALKMSFEER